MLLLILSLASETRFYLTAIHTKSVYFMLSANVEQHILVDIFTNVLIAKHCTIATTLAVIDIVPNVKILKSKNGFLLNNRSLLNVRIFISFLLSLLSLMKFAWLIPDKYIQYFSIALGKL